ncbi:hypothetical protein [Dyella acidisoli]|uniref:DUF2007 domain-containing protein n=1 Tax=Dyella acidisoli TaxID=1867834 RepID=A0ABQ5XLH9_9GAMM|nr:hypothetical protein [Dyella acidisoli]GLQ92564.1 hypothetical protein GCM10007901_15150 [Dyella acidisoli]
MEKDLAHRFATMSNDELQEQFASGQFDEGALALLRAELNRRGLLTGSTHAAGMGDEVGVLPEGFRQLVRGLSPLNAQILLGRLQADGIDAHLAGANVTQTNPLWFQALGGVRIFVRTEQLGAALHVMNAASQGDYEVEEADVEDTSSADRTNNKLLAGRIVVSLIALLFGGIALVAIWSPSYEYFPYSVTPEPTSHLVGKWMLSALIVAFAAFWLLFVESAVRRQRRQGKSQRTVQG